MTKAELVAKVAKDAKTTKATAGKSLDAVIEGITKALKKGDRELHQQDLELFLFPREKLEQAEILKQGNP